MTYSIRDLVEDSVKIKGLIWEFFERDAEDIFYCTGGDYTIDSEDWCGERKVDLDDCG